MAEPPSIIEQGDWVPDGLIHGVYAWDPRTCQYAGIIGSMVPSGATIIEHGPIYKMTKASIKDALRELLVTRPWLPKIN